MVQAVSDLGDALVPGVAHAIAAVPRQQLIDTASAVLRIEQLVEESRAGADGGPSALFWLLLGRIECDARRLRAYVPPEVFDGA